MQKSEMVKTQVSLREVAENAGLQWDRKKSKIAKGDYWSPCPFHQEASASFHIVEPGGTGGFFKCFGCGEKGTVIDFVMKLEGIDFIPAVRRLADQAGIDGPISEEKRQRLADRRDRLKSDAERAARVAADDGQRRAIALWTAALPSRGVPSTPCVVADYLTNRGVNLSAIGGVPATLRVMHHLDHFEGDRVSLSGPAQIGAIGRDKILGVHRTWITRKGRARHGDGRKVVKQWIGRTGELMGQPCVLSPRSAAVVVGEGIETTLASYAALVAAGQTGWSAEAALSRGAITGPVTDDAQLWTPRPGVTEVLVLGEGSSKDPALAKSLYEGAAARLSGLGFAVRLVVPHGRWDLDADFADLAFIENVKD